MKLFVDDKQKPPDQTWNVVRTAKDAIEFIRGTEIARKIPNLCPFDHELEILSLDHDLGQEETGYSVALWLESAVHLRGMIPPKVLKVHSANPVGRARILQSFQSIARYCERNGMQIPQIEG